MFLLTPWDFRLKCPLRVTGSFPQCYKACQHLPVFPRTLMKGDDDDSLYLLTASDMALTHLILAKDYKVKPQQEKMWKNYGPKTMHSDPDQGSQGQSQDSGLGTQSPLTAVSLWKGLGHSLQPITVHMLNSWYTGNLCNFSSVSVAAALHHLSSLTSLLSLGGLTLPQLPGTCWGQPVRVGRGH